MLLDNIDDKIAACFTEEQTQFTDFLTEEQIADILPIIEGTGLYSFLSGGHDGAERKMLALSGDSDEPEFPIIALKGEWDRFGEIGHRDILGAVMASGIDRKCIGDIIVSANRTFFVFVIRRMADYIEKNITSIGRCSVKWQRVTDTESLPKSTYKEIKVPVSSLRIDCVIASVLHLSRNQAQSLLEIKKVFINHTAVLKSTAQIRPGDSINVRGFGKFVFVEQDGLSKKGKIYIKIKQFI